MNRIMLTVAVLGLAVGGWASAAEPTKAELETAARRAKLVEDLVTANRLLAFGKGEFAEASGLKDYQSPEALVAAAGILLRVQKESGGFEAVNDKGEAAKDGKSADLAKQADDLFKDARNLVKGNKARESEIAELIKQAQTVDDKRGAVGKPRTNTKVLKPGESVEITIGFVPGSPATVSYTTAGGPRQQCEIIGPNGKTLYDNTGRDGTHSWTTVNDDKKRMVTIRLTNHGTATHTVTVTTN